MSEESLSISSGAPRQLEGPEAQLLKRLLQAAGPDWDRPELVSSLRGTSMRDGGMGSLRLSRGAEIAARRIGRRIAELEYPDADGVPIIASLNVDDHGQLFEIDVWKVDFSPVIHLAPPAACGGGQSLGQ